MENVVDIQANDFEEVNVSNQTVILEFSHILQSQHQELSIYGYSFFTYFLRLKSIKFLFPE